MTKAKSTEAPTKRNAWLTGSVWGFSRVLNIWICFEFRISKFEFTVQRSRTGLHDEC